MSTRFAAHCNAALSGFFFVARFCCYSIYLLVEFNVATHFRIAISFLQSFSMEKFFFRRFSVDLLISNAVEYTEMCGFIMINTCTPNIIFKPIRCIFPCSLSTVEQFDWRIVTVELSNGWLELVKPLRPKL